MSGLDSASSSGLLGSRLGYRHRLGCGLRRIVLDLARRPGEPELLCVRVHSQCIEGDPAHGAAPALIDQQYIDIMRGNGARHYLSLRSIGGPIRGDATETPEVFPWLFLAGCGYFVTSRHRYYAFVFNEL
jgi:hypothetical protein